MEAFGRRVRALRLAVGASGAEVGGAALTIPGLALRAGINASVLGEIERGRVNVTLMTVRRLAQALGVAMTTLFED